jgi:hypothetical protein
VEDWRSRGVTGIFDGAVSTPEGAGAGNEGSFFACEEKLMVENRPLPGGFYA